MRTLVTLLIVASLLGCDASKRVSPPNDATNEKSGRILLERAVAAYRSAKAYSDQGKLRLSFKSEGQTVSQEWDAAVRFERPGRIRIDAYQAHVASDAVGGEKQFVARIDDPDTNNVDGQMVVRPAPEQFTLEELSLDPLLSSQLTSRLQRAPVQLELLLADDALAPLFQEVKVPMRPNESVDDKPCIPVAVEAAEGTFVFWIDKEKTLIRRVEFPAAALVPDLAADSTVSDIHLTAELTGATFEPKFDEKSFALDVPADAKQVRAFVVPPIADATQLLGKTCPPFQFTNLGGEPITEKSLEERPCVMYWYRHHVACRTPAVQLAALAEKHPEVQVLFICTEPASVGDQEVLRQWSEWKLPGKPLRDVEQFGDRVFEVRNLPYYIALDAQHKVQRTFVRSDDPTNWLPEILARVQQGDDLAAETREKEAKLKAEYEQVVAAGGPTLESLRAPTTVAIAEAKPFGKLKLKELWKTAIDDPQAMFADASSCHVFTAGGNVVTLNVDGEKQDLRSITLPENASPVLRIATTKAGEQRYVVFSPLHRQVRLYDDAWKELSVYPETADAAPPIRDLQVADLDADGEPELLIAFMETAGVHAISLTGERKWTNRTYQPIASLAVSHDDPDRGRRVLLTGRGGIGILNRYGNPDPEVAVNNWSASQLFTSHFTTPTLTAYAIAGENARGETSLVGLNAAFVEQWSYPLPPLFNRPVEFITSGRLRANSSGDWILFGADGSLHVVSEDGSFHDSMRLGVVIRGIAVQGNGEARRLIVATEREVVAYDIEE